LVETEILRMRCHTIKLNPAFLSRNGRNVS
jgi:hypothetical protein